MARRKQKDLKNANCDGCIFYKGDNRRQPWRFRVGDGMKVTKSGNVSVNYVELYKSDTKKNCATFQELYKSVCSLVNQSILPESVLIQIKANKLNNTIEGLQYVLSGKQPAKEISYPTFSELFNEFYEYRSTHKLKKTGRLPEASTMKGYMLGYNKCESIYNIPVDKITVEQLQRIADSVKQYGSGTIDKVKKVISGTIEHGIVRKEFAIKNKINAVEWEFVSREDNPRAIFHKEIPREDLDILWQHSNDYRAAWMLIMCYTGLRPDELVKIESKNIFLDERYMIGGEKTDAGRDRIIPICERIYPVIKSNMGVSRLCHHGTYNKTSYNKLLELVHEICVEINIKDCTPHDCRDTFASMMDRAGANKICTQQIIGHEGKDVTEKHYIKKSLDDLLEAVNLLQ